MAAKWKPEEFNMYDFSDKVYDFPDKNVSTTANLLFCGWREQFGRK